MKRKISDKRGKAKRRILIDSFVLALIIVSPFIFKSHEYLPGDPEATLNFLGLTIDRNGFADLNTYGWFLLGKLVPFYLLVIWFFTCKHWWYHIILIPVTMYAFQIFEVVYSDDAYVDTENMMWLLPVCMVVIPFVYFIRIKLYDKHVHGIDLEAMDAELNTLKNQANDSQSVPIKKKEIVKEIAEEPIANQYLTISEYINTKLSTDNLERKFKQFQHSLKGWLPFKS
jgi:hypothetical protein